MKIIKNNFSERLKDVSNQFSKGMFMVTQYNDEVNIMTIGWGLIGIVWNRPIFQIMISTSRYSYDLLEKSMNFSVNIPLNNQLKKELAYCGTHSKRDVDKVHACRLKLIPAINIVSPIIVGCDQYYECRIIAKQKLPMESLENNDPNDNEHYHMMYYGEIVSSYKVEGFI